MRRAAYRRGGWWLTCMFGGVGLLVGAVPASAQVSGSSGGSGSTGGGSSGGSFLGSSGSTGMGGSSGTTGLGGILGTSGSTGTTGGNARGSSRGTGTTNIFPQVPSTSNPFKNTYVNPWAQGQTISSTTDQLGTSSTPTAFGQPSLTITTTPTTTTGRGGAGSSNTAPGFNTVGTPRAPAFVTALGFAAPRPAPTTLANDAAQALARSTSLSSRDTIRVSVSKDGEAILLDGAVVDDRQKRLAEMLVRVRPGVHQVVNRLEVRPAPPTLSARR